MAFHSCSERTASSGAPLPDVLGPPRVAVGKAYSLGLMLGRQGAQLTLTGEFDQASAADLDRVLVSLDQFTGAVEVDMSRVAFLDSFGVRPLIEATRRRAQIGLPAPRLTGCGRPVRRLLEAAEIGGDPHLDVQAWDRLNDRGSRWLAGGSQRLPASEPSTDGETSDRY